MTEVLVGLLYLVSSIDIGFLGDCKQCGASDRAQVSPFFGEFAVSDQPGKQDRRSCISGSAEGRGGLQCAPAVPCALLVSRVLNLMSILSFQCAALFRSFKIQMSLRIFRSNFLFVLPIAIYPAEANQLRQGIRRDPDLW